MINQLIHIISEEAVAFEDFLHLLEEQKDALVTNDVEELNRITRLQQQKLRESQGLGCRREQLIEAIKKDNYIDGDVTVARIVEIADARQAERLTQLREIILGLDDKIAEVRNTNAMLLNQSREFVSRTMSILSDMANPRSSYDSSGTAPDKHSNVMLDRRI